MARVFTNIFTSVDGIVDAEDDWQFVYFDEELFEWVDDAWQRASTVVTGRPSFEGYERLRTDHPDSPVPAFLDRTPTIVVSDERIAPVRAGVEVVRRHELPGRIAESRDDAASGDVLVLGSAGLMRAMLEHQLIDEINVMILPVVVGTGTKSLSGDTDIRQRLRLERSRALSSGAVHLVYSVLPRGQT